jgi:hypothetical protein
MPVPRPSGGGRLTPISFFELDVRWLKRQGALSSGRRLEVRQTVNGRFCEEVTVCGGGSAVEVISSGGRESIPLTYTAQPFGGQRTWFHCSGCCQRAAILYGFPFRCRQCWRLAYPSQRQDRWTRVVRWPQKCRERLGGSANMLDPFPERPKGLHRSTYWRLMARATAAERALCMARITR